MLSESQKELLRFPFQRLPLRASVGSELGSEWVDPELDVIWKPSDNKILGVLPKDQFIIPHVDAHDRVEAAIRKMSIDDVFVSKHQVLRNGARVFTHYRLPTFKMDIDNPQYDGGDDKTVDTLIPEVILRNGYDDVINFGLEWGLYRVICENGARVMVMGHHGTPKSLMGDIDVDVIVNGVEQFLESLTKDFFGRIQEMVLNTAAELPVQTQAWLSHHLTDRLLSTYDFKVKEAQERLQQNISEWTLFNIITNVITHEVNSYSRRRSLEQVAARKFRFGITLR